MISDSLLPIEHHGPSTAVKFYDDDLVLVAFGPIIKVFNYKTSELLVSKKILKKNKIHGIAFDRDAFVFYGGRSFNILSYKQLLEEDNLIDNEKMVNDWIIAGEFSYNGLEVFLLTAHNVILSVDSYSQTLQWEKSVYGEKSILYSGSIKVTTKHEVYINAGTVMGGVIIWDLYKEEIVHNLVDHEGSIFNVKTSEDNKYMATCSDDRSIKLWDFKTGELLSTAWGHTARIWNLKFYNGSKDLVSVSEDLTARTWTITEDNKLIPCQTYELHTGRHIWGLDVNQENTYAATGGNDGRVRLIDINPKKVEDESEHFQLENIIESANIEYSLKKNEIVKGIWKVEAGLVVLTSEGALFIFMNKKWTYLRTEVGLSGFAITNGFTKLNIVIFTNSKGDSIFFKFSKEGKIIGEQRVHAEVSKLINALCAKNGETLYLLVESPNTKEKLILYHFDSELNILNTTLFEKGPTFVTTCFEIVDDIVFIGFRLSSIGIYKLSTGEEIKLIKKLSISDTVTSINQIQDSENHILLTITNRDGYYLYFKFNKSDYSHEYIHTNNLRKGFLEGSFEVNDELIVYGFKSSYFYIYNESREYEIAYENCGGAHRLWELFYEDGVFEFTYVRDKILTIRTINKPQVPYLLSEGTHGRELRDISIRNKSFKENNALYITGAEDTLLKLSSVNLKTGNVRNFWTIRKHTSGLQKVKFLNDNLIASSSAREEFFIWSVNEDFKYPLISLIGSLQPSSDNPDLRIMDFSSLFVYDSSKKLRGIVLVNVYSNSSIKVFYFDLEHNNFTPLISGFYKTCCLFGVQLIIKNDKILIITGSTDGHISVWNVTEEVQFNVEGDHLAYTEETLELKKLSPLQNSIAVHQNGIKSFEVTDYKNDLLVVSGGDDNGLGITEIKLTSEGITSEIKAFSPSAASSTITSVSPLSNNRVLVAGVDQFVRVWSYENKDLKLVEESYTTVADTGSSDSVIFNDNDYALVGGVGLSLWEIK